MEPFELSYYLQKHTKCSKCQNHATCEFKGKLYCKKHGKEAVKAHKNKDVYRNEWQLLASLLWRGRRK